MKIKLNTKLTGPAAVAFTLIEMVIAVAVVAVVVSAFYIALGMGFKMMQTTRENLRATQILMQRAETIRLYSWSQVTNPAWVKRTFVEFYDPLGGTNQATAMRYVGTNSLTIPGTNIPSAYAASMRLLTITVRWTNYNGNTPVPHSRTLQTHVARFGMQPYIYGGQ